MILLSFLLDAVYLSVLIFAADREVVEEFKWANVRINLTKYSINCLRVATRRSFKTDVDTMICSDEDMLQKFLPSGLLWKKGDKFPQGRTGNVAVSPRQG